MFKWEKFEPVDEENESVGSSNSSYVEGEEVI